MLENYSLSQVVYLARRNEYNSYLPHQGVRVKVPSPDQKCSRISHILFKREGLFRRQSFRLVKQLGKIQIGVVGEIFLAAVMCSAHLL